MTAHEAEPPTTDQHRAGVEEWWPHLSIPARHAMLRDLRAPMPEIVLDEIETHTGHRPAVGTRLSDDDLDFAETQIEPVD